MNPPTDDGGAAGPTAKERREAARQLGAILGRASTPKTRAAANGKLGGRPAGTKLSAETRWRIAEAARERLKSLADIVCNCDGGSCLDHKSTCPRGRTIRRRRKLGQPLT